MTSIEDRRTCDECGGTQGAHYGSCARVPATMRAILGDLDRAREASDRDAAQRATERQARYEAITAEAVTQATGAAFNPRGESILSRKQTVETCAAIVTFLTNVEQHGGSVREWRERVEALRISLKD